MLADKTHDHRIIPLYEAGKMYKEITAELNLPFSFVSNAIHRLIDAGTLKARNTHYESFGAALRRQAEKRPPPNWRVTLKKPQPPKTDALRTALSSEHAPPECRPSK